MTAPLATPLILQSDLVARLTIKSGDATVSAAIIGKVIESSQQLQRWCKRRFDERIETIYHTAWSIGYGGDVDGYDLWLKDDLRSVTTLTNGDGNVIGSSAYTLRPRNSNVNGVLVKSQIRLIPNGGLYWGYGSNDPVDSISVLGKWGYGGQWKDTGKTVTSGLSGSSSAASFTSSAALELGMMLKIDSEYIYVSAASGTTNTIERACNGSDAAVHANAAPISRWEADPLVQRSVARLTLISIEQDSSPLFANLIIGDAAAAVASDGTPKDVLFDVQKAGLRRPQRIMAV